MRILSAFLAILALLLIIPHAKAGEINTVIIASTENYPDSSIAGSVSEKLGIPVLLVNKDEIPQEVKAFLEENKPNEIILVGGVAVISKSVEEELNKIYKVIRLWGVTRYETAVELAKFFWPEGSKKALLVQDDIEWLKGLEKNPKLLVLAKEIAREEKIPILLIPKENVPEIVLSAVKELGVEEVILIGTDLSEEVRNSLKEAGIAIKEEISGKELEVLKRIKDRLKERFNGTLVVAGVANYKDAIIAPIMPNSRVFLVSGDEDIDKLVEFIKSRNVSKVIIVGNPSISEKVYEKIKDITQVERRGEGLKEHIKVISEVKNVFGQLNKLREKEWLNKMATLDTLRLKVISIANKTLEKAKSLENLTDEELSRIEELEKLFKNGRYIEVLKDARKIISEHEKEKFEKVRGNLAKVREMIEEERKSLKEKIDDLKRINREFGEKMANKSLEERLKIIEEFRSERKEIIEEIVKEAKDLDLKKLKSRIKEKSESIIDHKIGCGETEDKIEVGREGRFVKIEAEVNLPNTGYIPKFELKDKVAEISLLRSELPATQCLAKAKLEKRILYPGSEIEVKVSVDGEVRIFKKFDLGISPQPTPPPPPP
jgi:hypothetical protein